MSPDRIAEVFQSMTPEQQAKILEAASKIAGRDLPEEEKEWPGKALTIVMLLEARNHPQLQEKLNRVTEKFLHNLEETPHGGELN